jgi:hypothetical protein
MRYGGADSVHCGQLVSLTVTMVARAAKCNVPNHGAFWVAGTGTDRRVGAWSFRRTDRGQRHMLCYFPLSLTEHFTEYWRTLANRRPEFRTNSAQQNPSWGTNIRSRRQKIYCLYGTRRFITVFTKDRYWIPCWARWIHLSLQNRPKCLQSAANIEKFGHSCLKRGRHNMREAIWKKKFNFYLVRNDVLCTKHFNLKSKYITKNRQTGFKSTIVHFVFIVAVWMRDRWNQ